MNMYGKVDLANKSFPALKFYPFKYKPKKFNCNWKKLVKLSIDSSLLVDLTNELKEHVCEINKHYTYVQKLNSVIDFANNKEEKYQNNIKKFMKQIGGDEYTI